MRRYHRVKRRASLKPSTYTEGDVVDKEGISGKVGVHYPGRSVSLPCATFVVRRREELTEVSRRHNRLLRSSRRPERVNQLEPEFRERWRLGFAE